MSFRAKRRRVVERSEKSRVHQVNVNEILRYALDDKMIEKFYFDTPTFFYYLKISISSNKWLAPASLSITNKAKRISSEMLRQISGS